MRSVVYITDAAPTGMQWLTPDDAQRYGIDVKLLNLKSADTGAASQTPMQSAPTGTPVIQQVAKETNSFVLAANFPNDEALALLQDKYSNQVSYYGNLRSRFNVLKDKTAFFRRWPMRTYAIRTDSLKVNCAAATSCVAEGVLLWTDRGERLVSTGIASFSLGWTFKNNLWRVSTETGQVISRNVTRAAEARPAPTTEETQSPATSQEKQNPEYQLDASSSAVVSLSNLPPDRSCVPAGPITGTIVDRQFGADGLTMTGIVIETPDGSRTFVNIEVDLSNADMVTAWPSNIVGEGLPGRRSSCRWYNGVIERTRLDAALVQI